MKHNNKDCPMKGVYPEGYVSYEECSKCDDNIPTIQSLIDRHTELSWKLIEYKIMYYYQDVIDEKYWHKLVIPDYLFDQLDKEYQNLCLKLNLPNTVSHNRYNGISPKGEGMFEVDFDRPCVHLIMSKYGVENWENKIPMLKDDIFLNMKEFYENDISS